MAKKKRTQTTSITPKSSVEVVVFDDPSKKRLKKQTTAGEADSSSAGRSFDWHKARHEVFRFGIKGMEEKEQSNAKVSLAVKLGARPAPNKCINFKELLKQRKVQREEERVRQIESGNDRYKLKPLVARKKRLAKKDKGTE